MVKVPPETNEKNYLRNAFIAGAILIAIPLAYGSAKGFPKDYYIFIVPPLAGFLVIVYALENSVRHLRGRIELLEEDARDRLTPTHEVLGDKRKY
ncbi:MAG: hypothetical protein ACKVS6_08545 [Planctomycetota bacterium]